jgi:protein-disulfide isomerase
MLKQLYKRILTIFMSVTALAILSFSLTGCDQGSVDKSEEKAVLTTESAAEEPAAQEPTAQEPAAEASALDEPENEMAFLDYDMVIGDKNAPVEIIEYASFTCSHCAVFHNQVLPRIKEKYIDTGKAKLVFRSFMLNRIDANISQLTRCVPEKRYFAFNDILFNRQDTWYNVTEYLSLSEIHGQEKASEMFTTMIMEEIDKISRQVGLNKKKTDACGTNVKIGKYLFDVQQDAVEKYKINATPTIIVNGKTVLGNDYNAVEKAIEAALD